MTTLQEKQCKNNDDMNSIIDHEKNHIDIVFSCILNEYCRFCNPEKIVDKRCRHMDEAYPNSYHNLYGYDMTKQINLKKKNK